MGHAPVTAFVCISCRGQDGGVERPGQLLFDAVSAIVSGGAAPGVTVTPVECLSVCKRPCTIALAASGKWTYVVGDLQYDDHAEDVVAAAMRYGSTENGIIPWRERPQSFRKGIIARIPPLGFHP